MARGTTLAALLTMLKAELRVEPSSSVAPGGDTVFKTLLATQQKWLVDEYDFPFLKKRVDIALTSGTRYYDIPTVVVGGATVPAINFDARVSAKVKLNNTWMFNDLPFGIDEQELVAFDSDQNVTSGLVLRWDFVATSQTGTQIEVWPEPNQAQTLRFVGNRPLNPLLVDADTADLDDMLLVFFTAAQYLTGVKGADAEAMLVKFQKRLTQVIGKLPKRNERFVMGGDARSERHYYQQRPSTTGRRSQ
jgi:hypothetical protein